MLTAAAVAEVVPIANPSFDEPWDGQGAPPGWAIYAGGAETATLRPAQTAQGPALLIHDDDKVLEIGVTQTFAARAGEGYRVTVAVQSVPEASSLGAYLQLRFLPSGTYVQEALYTESVEETEDISVSAVAPPDTTQATLYLYTHRDPTPKVIVDNVRVESGVEVPPEAPALPEPVPPQYDTLKEMHEQIPLVADGEALCAIVVPASGAYQAAAEAVQQAIRQGTRVTVPIVRDDDPVAAIPLTRHLIVLGNRSTNRTSSALYDLFYSLVDLKYPGKGGHVVRTVHNPFGNGFSVVIVGGSDVTGVNDAARALSARLRQSARPGSLRLGWTMITRLGAGLKPNPDVRTAETWDDSKMYGATGYFGWNSISKRMAMYYMWGDEFSAREVVRLAFPDAQALKEIDEIDGERIENKKDPLAGTYHYNSHMMMLFWDLIEESPVFTDEERLRITNAFARQLKHRLGEGIYQLTRPPRLLSSRHGQWAAISHYVLGRYFNKYYPSPLWAQCQRGGELAFQSLHKTAWLAGESDNLFWYNTALAPILVYMVLTGDRKPLEVGTLQELLRNQEVLISGLVPDENLRGCAMTYLNQAAYLTGDGRWITYRDRCEVDTDIFRLGQSFWPDDSIQATQPTDLVGKWTIAAVPKGMWLERQSGIPLSQSFQFGSYRSAPDATGDYILLDGLNGASRNPYHTFDILELRLAGRTLLRGYHNQVLTSADGMVEPQVPMDAALLYRDMVGQTAAAVGAVDKMPFCSWRRTIAQRLGRYALICDDLTFRTESDNMKVATSWQPVSGAWDPAAQAVRMTVPGDRASTPGWKVFAALDMPWVSSPAGADYLVKLDSLKTVLLRGREVGQWMEMTFTLNEPFKGAAFADFLNYVDRGRVQVWLDGRAVGDVFDNSADGVTEATHPLGTVDLAAGAHKLRLEVTGFHDGLDKAYIGFRGLSLQAEGAPPASAPAAYELHGSERQETTGGGVVNMQWVGPVTSAQRRKVFYLLGERSGNASLACLQVSAQAAMAAVPQAALVVAGEEGLTRGELVVLAEDHLYGHALRQAGVAQPLVAADQPVDIDWDFATGALHVVTTTDTTLQVQAQTGSLELVLPSGRHVREGVQPAPAALSALGEELRARLAQARQQRAQQLAEGQEEGTVDLPPLPAPATAQLGERVASLVSVPGEEGSLIAAAAGKTIHLLRPDGQAVRTLECDDKIRVLRWWPETQLLLAGCVDEKVIAFTLAGERRWEFTSVMDPAVYEAAKPYWFKTAPGHEGIHGLTTGTFYDGKSQAFVGSACTLEVLDEAGQLVKRMPVFWGPIFRFLFLDGPEQTRNLVLAQWPNGSDAPWVLNSEKGLTGFGFYTTPPGHSYVGGWTAQQRTALTAADLDGDGSVEVITCVNGTWNRVTVYSGAGEPLYNAQFGAGASNAPYAQMRDMEVADLDGDGKQEILVGTHERLLVALDGQCGKLWSRLLPAAPQRVQAVTVPEGAGARLIVGCVNGQVFTISGAGEMLGQTTVDGAPVERLLLDTPQGPRVVLGTDRGCVAVIAP